MKKIKMLSIGNEERFNFNYYVFEKTQEAFEKLSVLFNNVLGGSWELNKEETKKGKFIVKKIKVFDFKDFHENEMRSISDTTRLDIFYGDKRMFITVICSEKMRMKINEELAKITKMPKGKKISIPAFKK